MPFHFAIGLYPRTMFSTRSTLFVVATSLLVSSISAKYQGFTKGVLGTDFRPNKCGYNKIWNSFTSAGESHFAHVVKPDSNNTMACGQCAKVRVNAANYPYPTNEVTVMITSVDDNELCPETDPRCKSGSLLLSRQAMRQMFNSDGTPSSAPIEWEMVPCPSDFVRGSMEYAFHPGTNNQFVSILPGNFYRPIDRLEAVLADGTVKQFSGPGEIINYGAYRTIIPSSASEFSGPFTIRAYAAGTNQVIETRIEKLPAGSTSIQAGGQFN